MRGEEEEVTGAPVEGLRERAPEPKRPSLGDDAPGGADEEGSGMDNGGADDDEAAVGPPVALGGLVALVELSCSLSASQSKLRFFTHPVPL